MPIYVYYCEKCDVDLNHKEPMMSEHRELVCPLCGAVAYRLFLFNKKIPAYYGGAATNALKLQGRAIKRGKKQVDVD